MTAIHLFYYENRVTIPQFKITRDRTLCNIEEREDAPNSSICEHLNCPFGNLITSRNSRNITSTGFINNVTARIFQNKKKNT